METNAITNAFAEGKSMTQDERKALIAKLQAEEDASKKKSKSKAAAPVLAPVPSKFAGNYPDKATAKDKLILNAIHASKEAAQEGYQYGVCYGVKLLTRLRSGLITVPGFERTPKMILQNGKPVQMTKTNSKGKVNLVWEYTKADAILLPAIDDAIARGIVTKTFSRAAGKPLYFDAREVAPSTANVASPEEKAAIAAEFAGFAG